MKSLEQINEELELLAEAERQERIDLQYEEFVEEMYYWLECDQWNRDMELYDEFG